jgi:uncharacterized damage-inducible protein DinB
MAQPNKEDYGAFYEGYVSKVVAKNLHEAVNIYSQPLTSFFINLPDEKADYSYASNKWSLKDLLQHIIDTERIMSYRVLRIARNDQTPLPGFEENDYSVNAKAGNRTFDSLKNELQALRKSTDLLITSLTEEQLNNEGTASGQRATANAIGYIIFGHLLHHKKIIEERYF